jgi:predicted TIM-barrel fold metal-dependent hydrolase
LAANPADKIPAAAIAAAAGDSYGGGRRQMDERLAWMISVDDHVLEPPGVWQDRLPAALKERAPRLGQDAVGEAWFYDGGRFPTLGLSAVAGKANEEFSPEPITYQDMRPGCYDPHMRLVDMDRAGVVASLSFPSFPRFCGQAFFEAADRELALLCIRAWNDWMLDEWCAAAPGRYLALSLIPLWDPHLAAAEIERVAAKGSHGIAFSENPSRLKDARGDHLPSIHDAGRYWDPVFAAAQDAGLPLCIHYGSSSQNPSTSADAPYIVNYPVNSITLPLSTVADWLFSNNLHRFPRLKICMSEGQIGWIAPLLERCEQVYDKQRHWGPRFAESTSSPGGMSGRHTGFHLDDPRRPTDIFRDHIFSCFFEDFAGVKALTDLDLLDNIMIEMDYPHSDSTWPNSISVARDQLAALSDGDAFKVLQGNAMRVHGFRPTYPPVDERLLA